MEPTVAVARLAGTIAAQSRPKSPSAHLIRGRQSQLFIPNGSRLYAVAGDVEQRIARALDAGDEAELQDLLVRCGLSAPDYVDNTPMERPRLYALSLAIAQKCNM